MEIRAPYTVDGQPAMGTYGAGTIADLAEVKEAGMNLVLGGDALLDPRTPEGAFCRENGIKVMYHLTQHLYGNPILAEPIDAAQTTIPLGRVSKARRESRTIEIDDERIRYQEMTPTALLSCERGVGGTRPAPHRRGVILFWPEPLAAEVAAARNSPNLWGWYVLDDSPGDAVSALRAMYRGIRRADPAGHPVCAGYGGAAAIRNFVPGVCDIMMIYFYPCMSGGYLRTFISQEVQWLLSQARERVPGVPFIGVYQGFWGIDGFPDVPVTPRQLRDQMEDFIREGACGLIAFTASARSRGARFDGWNSRPDLCREMRSIHDEIRSTGGLRLSPEPEEMARLRIQPMGHWTHPRQIPGLVEAWHVVGPFGDPGRKILDAIFPPEHEIDLGATYDGKRGPVRWRIHSHEDVYQLAGVLGGDPVNAREWADEVANAVAYVTCTVTSPREQRGIMRIGSDDDAILWIDGRQVWRHDGERGIHRDQDVAPVTVPAGTSRILAKVYNRVDMWGFSLRVTDEAGRPLEGLAFSPTPADVERP